MAPTCALRTLVSECLLGHCGPAVGDGAQRAHDNGVGVQGRAQELLPHGVCVQSHPPSLARRPPPRERRHVRTCAAQAIHRDAPRRAMRVRTSIALLLASTVDVWDATTRSASAWARYGTRARTSTLLAASAPRAGRCAGRHSMRTRVREGGRRPVSRRGRSGPGVTATSAPRPSRVVRTLTVRGQAGERHARRRLDVGRADVIAHGRNHGIVSVVRRLRQHSRAAWKTAAAADTRPADYRSARSARFHGARRLLARGTHSPPSAHVMARTSRAGVDQLQATQRCLFGAG